jgi:hypothetical protein
MLGSVCPGAQSMPDIVADAPSPPVFTCFWSPDFKNFNNLGLICFCIIRGQRESTQ